MSTIIKFIKNQITSQNRNFVGIIVGRVGTGKSWSALKLGEVLDPTFDINRVMFKLEDLLDFVHDGDAKPGQVILFDEAGIGISNRQSYMNIFNKSMAFLLQTWRHRNLILFVTVPDIAFVDAGVRKLFDAIIECRKVVKSKGIVRISWKFIQVNPQSGKAYFHNLKSSMQEVRLEVSKPTIKLIHQYEKKKIEFTTALYKNIKGTIEVKTADINKESDINNIRRCKECGRLGRYIHTTKSFRCPGCGKEWRKEGG